MVKLPTESKDRKNIPLCTGVLDYFPDALVEVAKTSKQGNDQHNPGQPLHWDKSKSTDHADCIIRHLVDRGKFDSDGIRHSAKVAWRALALLQSEIDAESEGRKLKDFIEGKRILSGTINTSSEKGTLPQWSKNVRDGEQGSLRQSTEPFASPFPPVYHRQD